MWDIYNGVSEAIEQHKPQLIRLLEEHIDFDRLIPVSFKLAFYCHMGRKHKYHLESYIRAFVVQKLLGIPRDLPEASRTNPDARQQYINGHFCYAAKLGIVTNGLGICRHIAFFDDDFRKRHPEVCSPKTDNPDSDKEIGDSVSLKPVLSDFRAAHPTIDFKTFIGDSSFDSYDIYAMLKNDFSFVRACIPMNPRNSKASSAHFDASGTPICPVSGMPFTFLGKSGGKNRSSRFKWVCPGSVQKGSSRVCSCDHPCTDSSYGKCVYTYPDKDFRLYPGLPRATDHWNNLYRHRVAIERTINIFKDSFVLDSGKSHRTVTVKADLFLAGITQLIGVLLANALHKPQFIKSVRRLIA